MTEKKKYYPELNAKINFPEMEKNILNFWEEDKTFEKSVHNRDGAAEFVFYDGPPFANGTPHYGHIMVSYVKDAVARFQVEHLAGEALGGVEKHFRGIERFFFRSNAASGGTATDCRRKCRLKNSSAFRDANRLRGTVLKNSIISAAPTS